MLSLSLLQPANICNRLKRRLVFCFCFFNCKMAKRIWSSWAGLFYFIRWSGGGGIPTTTGGGGVWSKIVTSIDKTRMCFLFSMEPTAECLWIMDLTTSVMWWLRCQDSKVEWSNSNSGLNDQVTRGCLRIFKTVLCYSLWKGGVSCPRLGPNCGHFQLSCFYDLCSLNERVATCDGLSVVLAVLVINRSLYSRSNLLSFASSSVQGAIVTQANVWTQEWALAGCLPKRGSGGFFRGEREVVEFHLNHSKLRKQTFVPKM